jgi:hypothetical protein
MIGLVLHARENWRHGPRPTPVAPADLSAADARLLTEIGRRALVYKKARYLRARQLRLGHQKRVHMWDVTAHSLPDLS